MRKYILMVLALVVFGVASAQSCIMYFWQTGCHNCDMMEPYLEQFESEYGLETYKFEIRNNATNREFFYTTLEYHNLSITDTYITPVIFMGDVVLQGYQPAALEATIIANPDTCCMDELSANFSCTLPESSWLNQITIPTIIAAGLIDSINPCAFAVMIFLLTYIMSIGARKRMLKVGAAYISMVFITYTLAGIGILQVVQMTGISNTVYVFAAVIALVAGFINVKDYFWYGKGFTLKIPESRKGMIQKYTKKASLPAAFILGFLVSLFELPCTGGIYLAILGLLSNSVTWAVAIPMIVLYNLIFVLPLVVILFLVYRGSEAGDMEKWRESRKKQMKLASGLFMIALGIIMLVGLL
jgi:cytochrome c biogenesis protein CcdA